MDLDLGEPNSLEIISLEEPVRLWINNIRQIVGPLHQLEVSMKAKVQGVSCDTATITETQKSRLIVSLGFHLLHVAPLNQHSSRVLARTPESGRTHAHTPRLLYLSISYQTDHLCLPSMALVRGTTSKLCKNLRSSSPAANTLAAVRNIWSLFGETPRHQSASWSCQSWEAADVEGGRARARTDGGGPLWKSARGGSESRRGQRREASPSPGLIRGSVGAWRARPQRLAG